MGKKKNKIVLIMALTLSISVLFCGCNTKQSKGNSQDLESKINTNKSELDKVVNSFENIRTNEKFMIINIDISRSINNDKTKYKISDKDNIEVYADKQNKVLFSHNDGSYIEQKLCSSKAIMRSISRLIKGKNITTKTYEEISDGDMGETKGKPIIASKSIKEDYPKYLIESIAKREPTNRSDNKNDLLISNAIKYEYSLNKKDTLKILNNIGDYLLPYHDEKLIDDGKKMFFIFENNKKMDSKLSIVVDKKTSYIYYINFTVFNSDMSDNGLLNMYECNIKFMADKSYEAEVKRGLKEACDFMNEK